MTHGIGLTTRRTRPGTGRRVERLRKQCSSRPVPAGLALTLGADRPSTAAVGCVKRTVPDSTRRSGRPASAAPSHPLPCRRGRSPRGAGARNTSMAGGIARNGAWPGRCGGGRIGFGGPWRFVARVIGKPPPGLSRWRKGLATSPRRPQPHAAGLAPARRRFGGAEGSPRPPIPSVVPRTCWRNGATSHRWPS